MARIQTQVKPIVGEVYNPIVLTWLDICFKVGLYHFQGMKD